MYIGSFYNKMDLNSTAAMKTDGSLSVTIAKEYQSHSRVTEASLSPCTDAKQTSNYF